MTHQEKIDDVMDWFEFEKVEKAMVALDWQWRTAAEGIPTVQELRREARKRLREAIQSGYSSTGGFTATYSHGVLKLAFIIEGWETDNE